MVATQVYEPLPEFFFFFFLAPSPFYPGMQELSHSGLMVGKRRYALSFPVVTCSHPSNFDAITLWNLKFKMKLLIYNSIIHHGDRVVKLVY